MLKRVVLISSLSCNFAVLAGLAYGAWFSSTHASSEPSLGPLFRDLSLSAEQREELNRSNREAMDRILTKRDGMRRRWAEGVDLLSAPEVDWAAVGAKQPEIAGAQEAYQAVFFQVWMDRAKFLNAEQRQKLFAGVRPQIENGTFFNWRAPERSPREVSK